MSNDNLTFRYVEERDAKGRIIEKKEVKYVHAGGLQRLNNEIEANLETIKKEKEQEAKEREAKELEIKLLDEAATKTLCYKRKYSKKNFIVAYQRIMLSIAQGLIEEDESFLLLEDKVLYDEISVEEAINIHPEIECYSKLKKLFESITSKEGEE